MVYPFANELVYASNSNVTEFAVRPIKKQKQHCHFDRRDGAFCRPEAEKSLFNLEISVRVGQCSPSARGRRS